VARGELGARDEVEHEGALVRFEPRLPVALPDDDAARDLLRVGEELVEADGDGAAGQVAEGRLIEPVDEVAGLLKFD
jgi:hypothetical protein